MDIDLKIVSLFYASAQFYNIQNINPDSFFKWFLGGGFSVEIFNTIFSIQYVYFLISDIKLIFVHFPTNIYLCLSIIFSYKIQIFFKLFWFLFLYRNVHFFNTSDFNLMKNFSMIGSLLVETSHVKFSFQLLKSYI